MFFAFVFFCFFCCFAFFVFYCFLFCYFLLFCAVFFFVVFLILLLFVCHFLLFFAVFGCFVLVVFVVFWCFLLSFAWGAQGGSIKMFRLRRQCKNDNRRLRGGPRRYLFSCLRRQCKTILDISEEGRRGSIKNIPWKGTQCS